jgi:CheY-like chemotaxis protein
LEVTLRLLLVDDDPGLRALLRATLDAVDIEFEDAEDAVAAAEAIRQRPPDAIVLDVNLPGMDGLAFCAQLKRNRRTKDIPIIVLSGSDGGSAEAALEAGADSFLRKPFSPLELLAIVERLAGGLFGIPFRATRSSAASATCSRTPTTKPSRLLRPRSRPRTPARRPTRSGSSVTPSS